MKRLIRGAALVTALASSAARAGPPFLTDDPEPTDLGRWEIYAPLLEGSGVGGDYEGSIGAELNYGAARGLQITVGLPASFSHDAEGSRLGHGDLAVAAKYRFFHDAAAGLSIAAFPGVTIPTASRGLGNPRVTAFLPIWAQKNSGSWSVFGGGGYTLNPGPDNRNYWTGGVAVTRALSDRLLIGVEADRQGPDAKDARAATSLGVGAIVKIKGPFRLLASGGPTFTDRARRAGYHGFIALGIDL